MSKWRLPNNLEDLFSNKAKKLELFRRKLIDLFADYDYQYIMPSLLEFEDSLKAYGKDLDIDTFKVVDQSSGRMMGISSDLTTQAARVDAYLLSENNSINKLCYAGQILKTKAGPGSSRELFQVGLEYFGNAELAADIEIQTILIKSLMLLGCEDVTIDVNDLGIYKILTGNLDLLGQEREELAAAMMLKDKSLVKSILKRFNNKSDVKKIISLLDMVGDKSILEKLKNLYGEDNIFVESIKKLEMLSKNIESLDSVVTFDFSDIRGYQYHSGIVCNAYAKGFTAPVAQGGRYDNLNEAIGLKRPATGFSLDLRYLINNL